MKHVEFYPAATNLQSYEDLGQKSVSIMRKEDNGYYEPPNNLILVGPKQFS